MGKQFSIEEVRRSSQNFENTLDTTNLDSDSRYKPDIRSSSLSHLGHPSGY
ncbi:5532_t:CDS:2 [Funneliformis caledonium]|uniref:5532_t:CDS:1 n=1 Tax=Funneliformis caledonium TaxID=1117310 RepID=A0A9N8VXE2_9GLOM|nr:5532_t:CDS:2 [Funneliformis caledonium]